LDKDQKKYIETVEPELKDLRIKVQALDNLLQAKDSENAFLSSKIEVIYIFT